jgi:hypothetical protein
LGRRRIEVKIVATDFTDEHRLTPPVIPAQAGIQYVLSAEGANSDALHDSNELDSGLRRNDGGGISTVFICEICG